MTTVGIDQDGAAQSAGRVQQPVRGAAMTGLRPGRRSRARAAAVGALAAATTLLAGHPYPAAAGVVPSVTGSGVGYFADDDPHFPGDRVQVQLSARGVPGDAAGRFTVLHHRASGELFAHLHGHVDCVSVTGSRAVVTGWITGGQDDLGIPPEGHPVSLRIDDDDPDVLALDVGFLPEPHDIADCTSSPDLVLAVRQGGFRVAGS